MAWQFEEKVKHLLVYTLVLGIGFNLKLGVCLLYLSTGKANIHKSPLPNSTKVLFRGHHVVPRQGVLYKVRKPIWQ